ncbi:glycine cleavage system protein GcvH [Mobilibacterium timonense]|uniref:glycine cleavage system protein GcvH n=1 Tax=Mobilibacterium timonense TaxID=1871012 RepID=UPI002357B915|nr:glycine cleavage system protein GcvH [Mobilibacterium timonense]MBM6991580.1 glycine cleavage system protein GcvH [Mobilibacterium timonense]
MIDPKELKYSKSHEWVRYDGDDVVIGISDYAQESLGDLVFVNLPEVDDELTVGEALGDVESVKAVSDIISPVSGKVTEINEALLDSPEMINEDPYDAWFVKVTDVQETEDLLSADEYDEFVKEEEA